MRGGRRKKMVKMNEMKRGREVAGGCVRIMSEKLSGEVRKTLGVMAAAESGEIQSWYDICGHV